MYCWKCGAPNDDDAQRCARCGAGVNPEPAPPPPPPAPRLEDDRLMRVVLPVGRSGLAIAAGYVGLISVGVFPLGPVAIVLSILAIRDIRRHPEKLGRGRAGFGLACGILGTLILIGMLIALLSALGRRQGETTRRAHSEASTPAEDIAARPAAGTRASGRILQGRPGRRARAHRYGTSVREVARCTVQNAALSMMT